MFDAEYGDEVWFHLLHDCATVFLPVGDLTMISVELGAQYYWDTGDVLE